MIRRREFIVWLATAFSFIMSGCIYRKESVNEISNGEGTRMKKGVISKVYIIKTNERSSGIKELLKYFDTDKYSGKKVSLKANFNSRIHSRHPHILILYQRWLIPSGKREQVS